MATAWPPWPEVSGVRGRRNMAAALAPTGGGGGAAAPWAPPAAAAPWAPPAAALPCPRWGRGGRRGGRAAALAVAAAPGFRSSPGLAGWFSPARLSLSHLPFVPRHGRRAVGRPGAAAMEESAWACLRRRSVCVRRVRYPKPRFQCCCFCCTWRNK